MTAPTSPGDQPPGPGYWKASDGNWYPPEPHAGVAPPPPNPAKKGGCLKWMLIGIAAIVVVGIIAAVASGGGSKNVTTTSQTATTNGPGGTSRPDAQSKDHEAALGQSVQLAGYTTMVSTASFQQKVSVIETDGYLVADVAVENRNAKAQRYSTFDFKLQTPSGQVVDANFSSIDGQLGSGDLVQGGKASGKVVWKVGSAKGAYFVIYKPNPFDASRGVWKVTI